VSGFSDDPGKMQLTVLMSQIMFPFILLVALAAVLMGTLNSLGRFGIPALSPAIFNVITIIVALTMLSFFNPPILVLAVGVIIGGMGQFAVQIPQLRRQGYNLYSGFIPGRSGTKNTNTSGAGGDRVAAWQINVVVGTIIASHLDSGSISNLYYALRLMHFPLGVFGVALATVSLPELSAQVAAGEIKSAGASQRFRPGWLYSC